MQWMKPWGPMPSNGRGNHEAELRREVGPNHPLHDVKLTAMAVRGDNDDVLFRLEGRAEHVVVHLTWSGHKEPPPFPFADFFSSFEDWVERGMKPDSAEWEGGT